MQPHRILLSLPMPKYRASAFLRLNSTFTITKTSKREESGREAALVVLSGVLVLKPLGDGFEVELCL